jgi:fluoroacetyl-CoA thioesterase
VILAMKVKKLELGLVSEAKYEVNQEWSATTLGSGTLEVLGTPAIGIVVEQICREMIDPLLDAGRTSVGSTLNIRHLAPTPVGDVIRLRAEIVFLEKNVIEFEVKIWDSFELVGEADHRRVIIDVERFLKHVHSKPPHVQ